MCAAEALAHADVPNAAAYAEWSVAPELRDVVACVWAAQIGALGERHAQRIIPDGCIDLVFYDNELTIAGPDTRSVELEVVPHRSFVGLRFHAGCAPAILGVSASELRDRRINAADVLGTRARELRERVASASSLRAATTILEQSVTAWHRTATPRDTLVACAIIEIQTPRSDWTIASLAAKLGVSERQLRRRFTHAVGYGPKFLERVSRLRRFIQAASCQRTRSLAALAAEAGYADQSHLTRECRELTELTPAQLLGYPVTAA